jgi:diketogulonate reductase-like aldo/keto reductase
MPPLKNSASVCPLISHYSLPYSEFQPRAEYIDLFLIHDPMSGTERRLATYKALLEAQKSGKVRSVGVSN